MKFHSDNKRWELYFEELAIIAALGLEDNPLPMVGEAEEKEK